MNQRNTSEKIIGYTIAIILFLLLAFGLKACKANEVSDYEKDVLEQYSKVDVAAQTIDQEEMIHKLESDYGYAFKKEERTSYTSISYDIPNTDFWVSMYTWDYKQRSYVGDEFYNKVSSFCINADLNYLTSDEGIKLATNLLQASNFSITEAEVRKASQDFKDGLDEKNNLLTWDGRDILKSGPLSYERFKDWDGTDYSLWISVLAEDDLKLIQEARKILEKREK